MIDAAITHFGEMKGYEPFVDRAKAARGSLNADEVYNHLFNLILEYERHLVR